MFFTSNSLGLEINSKGAAFALISGKSSSPKLERISFRPFPPGLLRASLREPNITDSEVFVSVLREAHAQLLYQGTRLTVTLPDGAGRIMLLDVEGRFRSRAEALDIIRWKIKKSIPFDIADAHIDYQQLIIRETGEMSLLVALASRESIVRYEELIIAAGLVPARLEFNALSICRAFEKSLAVINNGLLAGFYDNSLVIIIFNEGVPEFIRLKELPGNSPVDRRVYTEINSSVLAYRERFPEREIKHAACFSPPGAASDFLDLVSDAAGCASSRLDTRAVITTSDSISEEQIFQYTAAIGAAFGGV